MDVIETGPNGTTLHEPAPFARPRASAARKLTAQALAGKLRPIEAARASRLGQSSLSRFRRARAVVNAGPRVFRYCWANVPDALKPVSFLGRLTYASVLSFTACRKLWRQEIGFVTLPGRVIFKGRTATAEEVEAVRKEGADRFQLRQNGQIVSDEAFYVVLSNTRTLLAQGDIVIEERL